MEILSDEKIYSLVLLGLDKENRSFLWFSTLFKAFKQEEFQLKTDIYLKKTDSYSCILTIKINTARL